MSRPERQRVSEYGTCLVERFRVDVSGSALVCRGIVCAAKVFANALYSVDQVCLGGKACSGCVHGIRARESQGGGLRVACVRGERFAFIHISISSSIR